MLAVRIANETSQMLAMLAVRYKSFVSSSFVAQYGVCGRAGVGGVFKEKSADEDGRMECGEHGFGGRRVPGLISCLGFDLAQDLSFATTAESAMRAVQERMTSYFEDHAVERSTASRDDEVIAEDRRMNVV